MSSEPVFEVTFECGNCGDEWSDEFPPRTTVRDSKPGERASVLADDCDEWGTTNCECCETVACPTCERLDDVHVQDRTPIEEGDDVE